uniref:hypothetical protein n=1 Tax=Paractinoplanes polyasparticus TaxID=2856853 RepID=UPI001C859051|nr:hypothetical protein [Actinoplanes polyasparticus]
MGRLVAAYRRHPFHGMPISQEIVGSWVGRSQAQISRMERGRPEKQIDTLTYWANLLSIPQQMLWFETSGRSGHDDAPLAMVGSPLASLRALRLRLDEAIAATTVSPAQMRIIEEATHRHIQDYPSSPPALMLTAMAAECSEVVALSRRRQPAAIQSRLSACAALLATLLADALMRLGAISDAQSWYRTARIAADDSAQIPLAVLVRAQAAMLPFYFGDPRRTIELADEALALPHPARASSALAAAGRARALARIGAAEQARAAVELAKKIFDDAGEADSDAAFRFPAKRLLFYLSGAATWNGDTATAYRLQDEALELYQNGGTPSIDPTLILMDRARCLVTDRRVQEAANVAHQAIAGLAEPQRTEIVLTRAEDVLAAIPSVEHRGAVHQLDGYLRECRRQARILDGGQAVLQA